MKNKLRFILPRLIAATAVAGLAALVITTLFKLLLGITLLAIAITLIARTAGKLRKQLGQYVPDTMPGLGNSNAFGGGSAWANPIQPVTGSASKQGTSIVPID